MNRIVPLIDYVRLAPAEANTPEYQKDEFNGGKTLKLGFSLPSLILSVIGAISWFAITEIKPFTASQKGSLFGSLVIFLAICVTAIVGSLTGSFIGGLGFLIMFIFNALLYRFVCHNSEISSCP